MSKPPRCYIPLGMPSKEREKKRKSNVCAECGEWLSLWLDAERREYLACHRHNFNEHEGIAREASQYQQKGMEALTIKARRDILDKEFGTEATTALEKYQGVVSLTKIQAREVLATLWPGAEKASPAEYFKAMMLCTQYGLNPLMKHLFLVPFWNEKRKIYEHVCIQGITSNRLIASRKHHWTFLDDTPRVGSEAEETKHYGEVNPDILRCIVKMRDVETGAEVTAWGEWAKWKINKQGQKVPNQPKGVDKGNSLINMGCIRAERKGLDMLYPADVPPGDIPVADEHFIDGEARVLPDDAEEVEDTYQESEPPVIEQAQQAETKAKTIRDSLSIKDFGGLYTACKEDWPAEFKTRQAVWKELGVSRQEEISDLPSECYQKIAAARK